MPRAQSSVEFLSTYSFLFLIMGLIIAILVFITSNPSSILPSQCAPFSGPACNLVFASSKGPNSIITFSLSNSQSVPINITNMTVTVRGTTSIGACTPYLIYPGQGTTCTASIPVNTPNLQVQGFYNVNSRFCNSGISNVSKGGCSYETVSYGGSFITTILQKTNALFSVVASTGPATLNLIAYSPVNGIVPIPGNFVNTQNGFWIANITGGRLYYAFANGYQGNLVGSTYSLDGQSYKTAPFPATLTALANNNIACSAPYNSTLSLASTTLYMGSTNTVKVIIETDGAMEVFYRPANVLAPSNSFLSGSTWNSVWGGAAWHSQGATQYTNTITLNKGFYYLDALWSDNCGSGATVLQISGLT